MSTEIAVLRAKVATCGGTNCVELRAHTKMFSPPPLLQITLLTCFQHLKADKIHLQLALEIGWLLHINNKTDYLKMCSALLLLKIMEKHLKLCDCHIIVI